MRSIKSRIIDFRIFQACKKYNIKDFVVNEGGFVDVDGHVNLGGLKLDKIPIKFGKINGSFFIDDNNLTSLVNCPTDVTGVFDCSMNKLQSLFGCPERVGRNFKCAFNQLKSLEGSPSVINDDFVCNSNLLETFVGSPKFINGNFNCYDNLLKSFDGFPDKVYNFESGRNPIHEIYKIYPCIEFIEMINEYGVINGSKVSFLRLQQAVIDSGGPEIEMTISGKIHVKRLQKISTDHLPFNLLDINSYVLI